MTIESEFHEAMLELYWIGGRALGYWANYYLREVRSKGGLATAQRLLRPGRKQAKGLRASLAGGRPDLTVEFLVLQPRFSSLFTPQELAEAKQRIGPRAARRAAMRRGTR